MAFGFDGPSSGDPWVLAERLADTTSRVIHLGSRRFIQKEGWFLNSSAMPTAIAVSEANCATGKDTENALVHPYELDCKSD